MPATCYIAVDLGASSGRHLAGLFDGTRLTIEELYRFENGPTALAGRLYWDLLQLWQHVQNGLHAAQAKHGDRIASIAVDTWGVDFALLARGDELLGNPVCYRDSRTDGILDRAFKIVPREEIFAHTGLQFMQINTLYQLLAMKLQNSPMLGSGRVAVDDSRSVPLAADGRQGERNDQRHDDAVFQSGETSVGDRFA